jgi:hypothetical protein
MLDYTLRQQGMTLAGIGELDLSSMLGNLNDSPLMAKAPPFIRDDLMFPYSAGADFSQNVLLARGGWPGFHIVFENPPASSQQVMHPDLYLRNVAPGKVDLPDLAGNLPKGWKKLDDNVLGEFGLQEVLKQFLDEVRATQLAAVWAGDRYALYEQASAGKLLLAVRVRAANDADASRLFGGLSEAFSKKYADSRNLTRGPNFLSFEADEGGIFLRCVASDCVSLEGANRLLFDQLTHALGWPDNPAARTDQERSAGATRRMSAAPLASSPPALELHP